ncbi:putative uncharacterized protein DDB_G0271606 isoform X3 [Drosophila innubila]|uniref:putative uncharacterized protein DDB_G0271606 isoform X3 n=1 Tax=Drosophila innubila TaxID=198719 RepID=UPI00148D7872|nr:putative uncharacterized protein DDB_G0271606 isoform X3 [Drosophila innubila]
MAPTPPVKLIMKNECDTSRSTGAVPKQTTTATTTTSTSPVSTNTSSSSASRSVTNRARNSSLIKQQQEKREREREKELTSPLQCGTYKALYDLLERATLTKSEISTQQLQQREALRQLAAEHSYDPADQQQRYCFPVRPVQRVQHQQQPPPTAGAVLRLRPPATTPNATVGVVTPNTTNGNEEHQSIASANNNNNIPQPSTALQTLVRRIFGPSANNPTRTQVEKLRTLLGLDENWNNRQQLTVRTLEEQLNNMVHEINPNGNDREEGVVNSTSLEDVALSEMSDIRAQSIQSLHSAMETPTPDTTPSFDELQQRLDASNRNMQHLQDEQQKLLQIQNMAKTHLNEMEELRQHAGRLPHNGDGDAPNYESVQQVQDDMASLVGRMKNLTAFIHNQNELSSVLGDDGPEILAEQQALQEKLESLRTQREDMRELVNELNSINRTARQTAQTFNGAGHEKKPKPKPKKEPTPPKQIPKPSNERVVPVEYQRNAPLLRQEAADAAQRALHAQAMINQKTADIDALKAQMAKLKGMLNTVNQIDESTPSVGKTLERIEMPIEQRVHDLNDVTSELRAEAALLQKERERILELKAEIERRKRQAAAAVQLGEDALQRNSLTPTPTPCRQREVELEQEVEVEVEEEEEEAKPTFQVPSRSELRAQCDQLRQEYEQKQREYAAHYTNNNNSSSNNNNNHINNMNNTTSEADDEGNDDTDSDRYFGHVRASSSTTLKRAPSASTVVEKQQYQQQQQQQQQQQLQQRRNQQNQQQEQPQQQQQAPVARSISNNEEELNMTLDSLSLGHDSIQSSSTRSQYMPPPMNPVQGIWATHNAGNSWHPQATYVPTPPSNIPAAPVAPTTSSNASSTNPTSDAVLLQQFMQTQQVLINSVCQCNQTLWHQQREIDNLNNQIHVLQDRLNTACQDHAYSLRSESVPPVAGGLAPNNLCLGGGSNRAQSEQLYSFGASHQSAFSNYHRSSHRNNIYSSNDPHQQQTYLNNAAPPPPPPPPPPATHYNNETPLSPGSYRASPGPIFMNHHNNTIHQNNANLRTQNQHANNLHSLPETGVPPPTLNNQVPPGNRANNYWDNFRR